MAKKKDNRQRFFAENHRLEAEIKKQLGSIGYELK